MPGRTRAQHTPTKPKVPLLSSLICTTEPSGECDAQSALRHWQCYRDDKGPAATASGRVRGVIQAGALCGIAWQLCTRCCCTDLLVLGIAAQSVHALRLPPPDQGRACDRCAFRQRLADLVLPHALCVSLCTEDAVPSLQAPHSSAVKGLVES